MTNWKAVAIVFMILFFSLLALDIWGYSIVVEEERKTNECYYNICEEYPNADLVDGLCSCYDYNYNSGQYEVMKTKYID